MYDARQTTVEEVRFLLAAGYRRPDTPAVEAGIARRWRREIWWRIAVNKPLSVVIHKLARS
jgi:hypothetical protein